MAKFYRPRRWDDEAILEEHRFIRDCVEMEIPTVAPLEDAEGSTLSVVEAVFTSGEDRGAEDSEEYRFALFPKRSGRNFDAESDEDWLRLGALIGRVHTAALHRSAGHRQQLHPAAIIPQCLRELEHGAVVHPDHRSEFFDLAREIQERTEPLFDAVPLQRLHGDCHRGNILERPREGLLLIDFDDMMIGPAMQDLWLLLPGRQADCPREFNLLAEGYEQFRPFDYSQRQLIEPLRILRMLYYLSWSARQRHDRNFRREHPYWGSSSFWSKEIEDLREQLEYLV
jgi:Ser/Thr protein kinase RdoA (MazF antagonist)